MIVMDVGTQMLGELVDAVGEDSNLYLGGTGVALMGSVLGDDLIFYFFADHNKFHLSIFYPKAKCRAGEHRATRLIPRYWAIGHTVRIIPRNSDL